MRIVLMKPRNSRKVFSFLSETLRYKWTIRLLLEGVFGIRFFAELNGRDALDVNPCELRPFFSNEAVVHRQNTILAQ